MPRASIVRRRDLPVVGRRALPTSSAMPNLRESRKNLLTCMKAGAEKGRDSVLQPFPHYALICSELGVGEGPRRVHQLSVLEGLDLGAREVDVGDLRRPVIVKVPRLGRSGLGRDPRCYVEGEVAFLDLRGRDILRSGHGHRSWVLSRGPGATLVRAGTGRIARGQQLDFKVVPGELRLRLPVPLRPTSSTVVWFAVANTLTDEYAGGDPWS